MLQKTSEVLKLICTINNKKQIGKQKLVNETLISLEILLSLKPRQYVKVVYIIILQHPGVITPVSFKAKNHITCN
jgi:hypothetical protein